MSEEERASPVFFHGPIKDRRHGLHAFVSSPAGDHRRDITLDRTFEAHVIAEAGRAPKHDGFRDLRGPVHSFMRGQHYGIRSRSGLARDGNTYNTRKLVACTVACDWGESTETYLMNVVEELERNTEEAKRLWKGYAEELARFRSVIKNDVESLQASARKTTEAIGRMHKAYSDVFAMLNSADMAKAIENAERLARACEALSNLEPHKMTFAVIDSQRGE